jgi:hypothetical protein
MIELTPNKTYIDAIDISLIFSVRVGNERIFICFHDLFLLLNC